MKNNTLVTMRRVEPEDAKAIAELHKKVVREVNSKFYTTEAIKEWTKDISEENVKYQFQNSDWVVAEADNVLVGFGQYSVADGAVYQINVAPDFLGRGIGRKLYEYIEKEFVSRGVEKISLNSTLNAVGFYRGLGFGVVEKTNIGSIEMTKMEKFLRDRS